MVLQGDKRLIAIRSGGIAVFDKLVGIHRTGTVIADAAGFNFFIQGGQSLFDRCIVVESVKDQDVDVVGVQTLQRTLHLPVYGFG